MIILHVLLPFLYSTIFFFVFPNKVLFGEFAAGVFIGFWLLSIDWILHIFFVQPEAEFSKAVKEKWGQRKWRQAIAVFITTRQLQQKLITRSILFLVAYVVLALYVLTSTGSIFGSGIVLGIGLHFCLDLLNYRRDLEKFHQHFLWQLKRRFSEREVLIMVGVFCTYFVLLSMLVLK